MESIACCRRIFVQILLKFFSIFFLNLKFPYLLHKMVKSDQVIGDQVMGDRDLIANHFFSGLSDLIGN